MSTTDTCTELGRLGNYRLIEVIARGSFGTVYKACHWESEESVAVKAVASTLVRNKKLLQRFRQECQMASKINHPNIVRVLEYCCTNERPFLVMEYVDGVSLGEKIERDGPLSEEEAKRIAVQVCQGLEQIHHLGLLHRDIKPDNILITSEGLVKIADLGLAKELDAQLELTQTGTGLGTPNFIAPEQFRDAKNADHRCDIYGLGAALYQAVTGVLPFADENPLRILMRKMKNDLVPPQRINRRLSNRMADFILKAMNIDPQERYSSSWKAAESLVDIDTGLGRDFESQAAKLNQWYARFFQEGRLCKATGRTDNIRQAIVRGSLGDPAKVQLSYTMAGPFRTLDHFRPFADLMPQRQQTSVNSVSIPPVPEESGETDMEPTSNINPLTAGRNGSSSMQPTYAEMLNTVWDKTYRKPGGSAETIGESNGTSSPQQTRSLPADSPESSGECPSTTIAKNETTPFNEQTKVPMWLSLAVLFATGLGAILAGHYLLEIF